MLSDLSGDRLDSAVSRLGTPELVASQPCDVSQREQLQKLWDAAVARFGADQSAKRFNALRAPQQKADRAAGIAASLNLAAIVVENAHLHIGKARWFEPR